MEKIKIYVAHPYGGLEDNKKKVEEFINKYKDNKQLIFISPIHTFGWKYDYTDYEDGINECLALLKDCDVIVMPDFNKIINSKGCLIEYGFAKGKNMLIVKYSGFEAFLKNLRLTENFLEKLFSTGGIK